NNGSCISSIPRIGSSAQDHEHDISNAPPFEPVYTVPNFNSLLGAESSHGEAVAAAYACLDTNGADFGGAQLFWNRGIAVFWMATGNTEGWS
ncbi:hypothetical protein G3O00_42700, partial [Burkholderia sp. Ac-20384]|nr:hypothetical protein [Burkholderia sp. Ac-20384]